MTINGVPIEAVTALLLVDLNWYVSEQLSYSDNGVFTFLSPDRKHFISVPKENVMAVAFPK